MSQCSNKISDSFKVSAIFILDKTIKAIYVPKTKCNVNPLNSEELTKEVDRRVMALWREYPALIKEIPCISFHKIRGCAYGNAVPNAFPR
jgi:hypothetical protein